MAVSLIIHYLSGGMALDVKELLEASCSAFYYVLGKPIIEICQCEALQIFCPHYQCYSWGEGLVV